MATDILYCNYFDHTSAIANAKDVIFQNTNCGTSYIYECKSVKTSSGKQKNDNKTMLPYVEKILYYLLTGKELIKKVNSSQPDHIQLDTSFHHLDLKLYDFELDDVLNKINRIMKLKDKDTSPIVIILKYI